MNNQSHVPVGLGSPESVNLRLRVGRRVAGNEITSFESACFSQSGTYGRPRPFHIDGECIQLL
jgi:hypothetical protein